MLEAIISGSAANNYSERELWAQSGELQRPNRLRTTAALEGLRHPRTKAAFQPKAPPQRWKPCATQNRVFHQSSTTSLIGGPEPRASGPGVAARRRARAVSL